MNSNIRIVEIPNEEAGDKFQLCRMIYDEEGYLIDIDSLAQFDEVGEVYNFIDQVYRAGLQPSVLRNEDGTYDL